MVESDLHTKSAARLVLVLAVGLALALFSPRWVGPWAQSADEAAADRTLGTWQVASVAGTVRYRTSPDPEAAWTDMVPGDVLTAPVWIVSEPDGAAELVANENRILVSANTLFSIPAINRERPVTRILQTFGTMFFNVFRRPNRHFEVQTPFLIAGVKGTTLGVSVDATTAEVSVTEGTVGVTGTAGAGEGQSADVSAGQTATASAAPDAGVSVGATP